MEKILLVGHGSPKKDANQMAVVGRMLHEAIHPGCGSDCVMYAYLQFQSPELGDTIARAIESGATRLIIHPFFLSAGNHVTSDIPEVIERHRKASPHVEFVYTEPLGTSPRLISLVMDRIREATELEPHKIEEASFEMLSEDADLKRWPTALHPLVKRVVHATADFSFIDSLIISPGALEAGMRAVRAGRRILTDVEMVRAGINSRALSQWGGEAVCHIGEVASESGRTRAEAAIEQGLDDSVGIVVIGNAPTALYKCMEMINSGAASPDLVIGVPVGFVRAVESKAALASQPFEHITNAGRRGGTPVAVALANAIIKCCLPDGGTCA